MKGIICYVDSNFAEKLEQILNEEFVAFEFNAYLSRNSPLKHKIIINTCDTKIHQECLKQIKAFCDGFNAAITNDED